MAVQSSPLIQPSCAPAQRRIRTMGQWPTSGFFTAHQDISDGTTWFIQRKVDTVVVHLGGHITHLETELEGCGSVFGPPMPGDVWVIPAHQRYCSEAKGGLVHYAELHLDSSIVNQLARKTVVTRPARARAGHFDGFLHRGILELEALTERTDDLAKMAAESLSHSLLLHFYSGYSDPVTVNPACREIRLAAREKTSIEQFVAAHLDCTLRLETMAALVAMTSHEFLIAFRAEFGTTPAQYVIEQRLRRARSLLRSSGKNITTIAFETGFSSHAHLSTVFRNRLHMTPHEFREVQRGSRGSV
jgi:AraC family transcriptional regulator